MRRLVGVFAASLATIALATAAQADPTDYGIESVAGALSTTQAGGHPDFTNNVILKTEHFELPALTRDVTIELPQGLLANPDAVPKCSAVQFVNTDVEDSSNATGCPQDSQVGVTHIVLANGSLGTADFIEPVFNLQPKVGEPARLGFIALQYPILIDTELRPDYGVTASVSGADTLATLYKTETTLWDVPAAESHDSERMTPYESAHNGGSIETPTGRRSSGLAPVPFTLNPTRCGEGFALRASADSYQEPERISWGSTTLPAATGCGLLDFEPSLSLSPTTGQAGAASGLDASLSFPAEGLEYPNALGEDEQKRVEVTLPEGVTVNPSQANGLGACSEAQFESETSSSAPGEGCPEDSKIGSVRARSPLLDEEAEGSIFVAKPYQNPYGSLIAVYMVLKVPDRGVIVKLPGKVELDAGSGLLKTTFGEGAYPIPQLPVAEFHLHFREGDRAPLVTPPGCGSYEATAVFESWGGHTATRHPSFQISSGCPAGASFAPGFEAGTLSNSAGSYSPLHMRVTRSDADQQLSRISARLAPGLLAKLAGVEQCPDVAIEAARARTGPTGGAEELARPSCPPSSQIGTVSAGAGLGSVLTYAEGRLYLAGPYHGDPLSVAAIVPAIAGPFDLGAVVTREALRVDPDSGRAEADGLASDAIPRILAGVPLRVRDLRIHLDRPDFTLNPTDCKPLAIVATLWGVASDPFGTASGATASSAQHFQAADCASLRFRPRLSLRLFGATHRGAHPSLKAVLRTRRGDANIGRTQVALPHVEFIDNEHFDSICTRVQFAAHRCPPGSIYGHATAKTPLFDFALKGPLYLRSAPGRKLPDVVAALRGPASMPIEVDLAGHVDSFHGGLRTTFASVPDAPVSQFVLRMAGGRKGLFQNSANLCSRAHRALAKFWGQNKRRIILRPPLKPSCSKKHGRHLHRR